MSISESITGLTGIGLQLVRPELLASSSTKMKSVLQITYGMKMEQRKGSVWREFSILNRVSRVGFIKEDVSKFLKSKIVKADSMKNNAVKRELQD